jgi:peptidyl-prolyl cis-trans isomerase SurA
MKTATAILVACVLAASTTLAGQTQGVILEQILVKVNGEIFTKTDLELQQITALRNANRQVSNPADLQNDAALKAALVEITPTVLVDAIDDLLLVQRGKELGFSPTADQLKDTVQRLMKQNNITTEAQLRQALVQEGLSYEEFEKNLERQYVIARVQQQEIMTRIQLTEEEAKEYYRTHTKEFEKPATVTIRELFVSLPTVVQNGQTVINVAAADEVAKKVVDIRTRATTGREDFAKLVTEFSESPSKANGGLIGPLNLGELAPAVKELLEKLKVGEVSEPIRTSNGFQLLKLETKSEATPEPFEAVREDIANRIGSSRLDGEQKKYIEKLRAQALIEWKNADLKKMYDDKLSQKIEKSGGALRP